MGSSKALNLMLHYAFCALTICSPSAKDEFQPIDLITPFNNASTCSYQLVETVPDKMIYEKELPFELAQTHEVFLDMVRNANYSIQMASFYLQLLAQVKEHRDHPTSKRGRDLFEALESASRDRKVKVEIIVGQNWTTNYELKRLSTAGIHFQRLDVEKMFGNGVLHSKFIIIDEIDVYLGSANLGWRALAHVKEFGIHYKNCQVLAADLGKIFKTYSYLIEKQPTLPEHFPSELETNYTRSNPMILPTKDGSSSSSLVYLGSGPKAFTDSQNKRQTELDIILDKINSAKKFVYISVMNYSPYDGYNMRVYWPYIDNALRAAYSERKVDVKLSVGLIKPYRVEELGWFRSLNAFRNVSKQSEYFGSIEVNFFVVPRDDFKTTTSHSRVKHHKYIVNDNSVLIGNSNMQPPYFTNTCGVGISIEPIKETTEFEGELKQEDSFNIVDKMKALFERDYNSEHSHNIDDYESFIANRDRINE